MLSCPLASGVDPASDRVAHRLAARAPDRLRVAAVALRRRPAVGVVEDEARARGLPAPDLLDLEPVAARGDALRLARLDDPAHRLLEARVVVLLGDAERNRQVVRADEDGIDTGHGQDLVQAL